MQDSKIDCQLLEDASVEKTPITTQQYNHILNMQQEILSLMAKHGKSEDILAKLCLVAESLLPNSVASIMLLNKENGLMSVLSAPSIPPSGHEALKNLQPGEGGGSCGNAVFRNEPQYVANTFEDPRWHNLRNIAIDFNLCSCWSMPVRNVEGEAIGTFALSSFEHREPALFHKKLLETAAYIVNIVLKTSDDEAKIAKIAFYDTLTGLANKTKLENIILTGKKQNLLLLNLNNFSYINTAYGYKIGDKLLQFIANALHHLCVDNLVFRINADEFAILCDNGRDIKKTIEKLQSYFYSEEINIDNVTLNISFSYGAACANDNVLRNAALALKQAKENGKNTVHIYSEDDDSINNKAREKFIKSNNIIHQALVEENIIPYFQGIHNNKNKTITKFESLARIQKGDEIIVPYEFIEPARLAGLLPEITKMMIEKSFAKMQGNEYIFSINITEDDLSKSYLINYLREKAKEYNIKHNRVILEILEGVSSTGKKNHIKQLNALKDLGFAIAIDDFGSEYSNFERVLDLDIDYLKIDARYIKNIDTDKKSYEITKAIVYFAQNAGIPCIAEFVHTQAVQNVVEELGIDYSQGFLFSEPSPEPTP